MRVDRSSRAGGRRCLSHAVLHHEPGVAPDIAARSGTWLAALARAAGAYLRHVRGAAHAEPWRRTFAILTRHANRNESSRTPSARALPPGPRPRSARSAMVFKGNSENAKTVLCTRHGFAPAVCPSVPLRPEARCFLTTSHATRRFQSPEGCRFGDRCNFAHGDEEIRSRPDGAGAHRTLTCASSIAAAADAPAWLRRLPS